MLHPHERVKALKGEGAFHWMNKAVKWERETGKKAIHFEIGEPDFRTPKNVCDAAVKALYDGKTKYVPSQGISELRTAVADFLGRRRGVEIDPDCVVVGPGCKPLINASFQCMVDQTAPNAAVILPDPVYGPYADNAFFVGAKTYSVPLKQEDDWRYDAGVLEEVIESIPAGLDKILVLVSPSNPTGGVLTRGDLKFIAKLAQEHDLTVVSDEIYDDIIFSKGQKYASVLSEPGMMDRTFLFHGSSKSWAMTGWRLGWCVAPKHFAGEVGKLIGHTVSCTAEFSQHAGIEAISRCGNHVAEMVAEYRRRRDFAVTALRGLGATTSTPMGSFYVFPDVSAWMQLKGVDETELCERMLRETGVVCLPGPGFGSQGRNHIRLSLVSSYSDLQEAFERIEKWLAI
ncbi:MAG: aminotransferase class I/II-fold pyridoxal phosphate-dependent enzyme [Candidatus Micrarchaeota archaeon]